MNSRGETPYLSHFMSASLGTQARVAKDKQEARAPKLQVPPLGRLVIPTRLIRIWIIWIPSCLKSYGIHMISHVLLIRLIRNWLFSKNFTWYFLEFRYMYPILGAFWPKLCDFKKTSESSAGPLSVPSARQCIIACSTETTTCLSRLSQVNLSWTCKLNSESLNSAGPEYWAAVDLNCLKPHLNPDSDLVVAQTRCTDTL